MGKVTLKFRHIHVHETFTRGCTIYVKLSKTQAIPMFSISLEKVKFKADDPVSQVRNMKFNTHEGASAGYSYAASTHRMNVKSRLEASDNT